MTKKPDPERGFLIRPLIPRYKIYGMEAHAVPFITYMPIHIQSIHTHSSRQLCVQYICRIQLRGGFRGNLENRSIPLPDPRVEKCVVVRSYVHIEDRVRRRPSSCLNILSSEKREQSLLPDR